MDAPLRFHLPEGTAVEITREVPPGCQYSIPYAEPRLYKWENGFYVEQAVIQKGFGFCLLNFSIKKRVGIRVEALLNFSTIQFTLKGEATCNLTGYGFMPLVEKTYTSMYIPVGTHYVWFEPGDYTFLYIILDPDHLQFLLEDNPHLSSLIQKILTESNAGMMVDRMNIDFTIMRLIKRLETLTLTGTKLKIKLGEIALSFIAAYHDHIVRKNINGRIIGPDEYADKIKLYVIDNITNPDLINMPALEKKFSASAKTIQRIFVKKFGDSPKHYIKIKRLERAFYMLVSNNITIKDLAFSMGYLNPSSFTQEFTNHYGFSPTEAKSKL